MFVSFLFASRFVLHLNFPRSQSFYNHAGLVPPSITPQGPSVFLQYFNFYFVFFIHIVKIACLPKLGPELIEAQVRLYIKKEKDNDNLQQDYNRYK